MDFTVVGLDNHYNRENQDRQTVGTGDENGIENRVRFSFNFNAELSETAYNL